MRTPLFQVDAFTSRRFAGNPAARIELQGECVFYLEGQAEV